MKRKEDLESPPLPISGGPLARPPPHLHDDMRESKNELGTSPFWVNCPDNNEKEMGGIVVTGETALSPPDVQNGRPHKL